MRNMQHLSSKHRIGIAPAACMGRAPEVAAPEDSAAAAMAALNDIGDIVPNQRFTHPDMWTQDRITAYALALMRLRECASVAGYERLMNACDALAVTVSRLIEDRSCACREKCEMLARFVVHARAMIQMSTGSAKRHVPDIRTASDRVSLAQHSRLDARTCTYS